MLFHVLNRGVGRMRLFLKDADFGAFEQILEKTAKSRPMRILSYCLLPNHWHFVLWPEHDGDLGAFMQKLTITHAHNWQIYRRRVGYGHLYQGRYKSFPIRRRRTLLPGRAMSNATPCGRTLSAARRNGGFQASGGA